MQPRLLLKRNFDFSDITIRFNPSSKWQIDAETRKQADKKWEEKLADYKGLGIVQSAVSNVILIALTNLKINSETIREVFKQRIADEMQDLIFIENKDIINYLSSLPSYRALIPELLKS